MKEIGSVYWIETNKVMPNPYQPRREFDEYKLRDLAESVRQYGVLQPLVVTKVEKMDEGGRMSTHYELIAGERRLRASKIAGLQHIPAIVRDGSEEIDNQQKFELAIIENLQREDLNPADRARAFEKLQNDFGLTHNEISQKMGKSREYVSNSIRVLSLPNEIVEAIAGGSISEGHARALLSLERKPEEQKVLFEEIVRRGLTVRETEYVAKKIARNNAPVRKRGRSSFGMYSTQYTDERVEQVEESISACLGVPVHIDMKGKVLHIRMDCDDVDKTYTQLFQTFSPLKTSQETSKKDLHDTHKDTHHEHRFNEAEQEEEEETFFKKKEDDDDDDIYINKSFTL